MARTEPPPVMEARRWLASASFPPERPLLNVSQAAPVEPPPPALRQAIAEAVLHNDAAHLYGPVLGLPALRAEVARQWSHSYGGQIAPEQVAITQGCNQAFAATISTLAGAGDEVILPMPWYFNHKMWLDMQGVKCVPLATGAGLIPDAEAARALITQRTRAIVLVSPNNPGGAEYPAEVVSAFRDLARSHKIALILDETYRDFDSRDGRPHELFSDPDWDDTLIHLYSFSKAFRLTGHRVGLIITSTARQSQIEKFLDSVGICPNQLGQIAALWGLENLGDWVRGERANILARKNAMQAGFAGLEGWELMGCGAYFAYVRHSFAAPSSELAQRLVHEQSILMLPGSMFRPEGLGQDEFRIAFANIDQSGIAQLFQRLGSWRP